MITFYLSEDDEERFYKHVFNKGEDVCWSWLIASDQDGYGRFFLNGRNIPAHRVAYYLATGNQPGDLKVCHICDNPPCCNPKYLFLGTSQDNVDDCIQKKRRRHLYNEDHQHNKYSNELILEIRESWEKCSDIVSSINQFAEYYNISGAVMRKILKDPNYRIIK